ncbi:MAG: cobalt ECF transporter T component CbiQ [Xenococcaceae cyanobacterium MO_188.B29]|nr:cobalt ECF transporter T component CbiQ [Xenococcaceae cyanobacterium MO_188.B29]
MRLIIDRYAYLHSPIHCWQQKYKLIGLISLIFAFSFVQNITLLPVILVITTAIFSLSNLPISFLISRLRYPSWFILAVVIFLPFVAGDTIIFQWGWLSLKEEGCWASLLISIRFFSILTISLVLFGTAPFLSSIKAMRSLGLPQVIVDMTLLAYRYLEELSNMVTTMQRAIKLRGFKYQQFSRRNLRILAQLTGSLLVRSYERSTRVYQAMILRGYSYNFSQVSKQPKKRWSKQDKLNLVATTVTVTIAISLIIAEVILPAN